MQPEPLTLDYATRLVAALEKAGWSRVGGRDGSYVRLRWPAPAWTQGVSLLVPLDPDAGDFTDLLGAARRELELIAERGRLVGEAFAELGKSDVS